MAVTRFYQPTQNQYVSQFIPTELPVDLMVRSLGAKQQQADLAMAKAVELGNFKQRALPEYDTNYVKGITDELEAFTAKSSSVDRTSPEYQREYLQLVNKIKKDEGLKAVASSVAQHDAYSARREELIKKGGDAWTPAMENDYKHRYNIYTAKGGKGYTGDIQLGDPLTLEGVNVIEDTGKIFSHLSASGYDNAVKTAAGTAYKKSWEGISDPVIRDTVKKHYDQWSNTPAYRQLYQEKRQTLGNSLGQPLVDTVYNSLPEKEKEAIDTKMNEVMSREFYEIGTLYKHGKSTSGLAEAQNKDQEYARKKIEEEGVLLATTQQAINKDNTDQSKVAQIKNYDQQVNNIYKQLYQNKTSIESGNGPTLIPSDVANLQAQARYINSQNLALKRERSQDWKSFYDKHLNTPETKKADALLVGLSKEQAIEINKIKDPELKKLLVSELEKSVNSTDYLKGGSDFISYLTPKHSLFLAQGSPDDIHLKNLRHLEERKISSIKSTKDKFNIDLTNEFVAKNEGKLVQQTSVTAPKGPGTTIETYNRDITAKPSGYRFETADGKEITGTELNNGVYSFKGDSYTTGNAVNHDSFGINGQVTFSKKVGSDPKTGKAIYKDVTLNVKAIPQGSNQQVNKNAIANDYYKSAERHRINGNEEQMQLALDQAKNYTDSEVKSQLDYFESNGSAETTHLNVLTNLRGGKTELMPFTVEKVETEDSNGDNISGYKLRTSHPSIIPETYYKTIDQVHAAVLEMVLN